MTLAWCRSRSRTATVRLRRFNLRLAIPRLVVGISQIIIRDDYAIAANGSKVGARLP